jgi:hypothetical protein
MPSSSLASAKAYADAVLTHTEALIRRFQFFFEFSDFVSVVLLAEHGLESGLLNTLLLERDDLFQDPASRQGRYNISTAHAPQHLSHAHFERVQFRKLILCFMHSVDDITSPVRCLLGEITRSFLVCPHALIMGRCMLNIRNKVVHT